MATLAQIAANQANAAKSSGPKTAEGKARSRANALKHGMAGAGVVVPEQDRALFEHRAATWADDLGALTEMDRYLASRAALASVRLDRCARQETAALAEKRDWALSQWWKACTHRAAVSTHARRLDEHTVDALNSLQASSMGCEWLADQWGALANSLETVGGWDDREMVAALHFVGQSKRPDAQSPSVLVEFWSACLALRGKAGQPVGMLELERFFGITEFAKDAEARIAAASAGLPDAAGAFEMLMGICEDEMTRLEALRRELWETVDTPSQQRALDLAAFDDSPAASLRLRYEGASRSDLHRAIEQVRKSRRARALDPLDVMRNEPNECEASEPEVVEETPVPAEVPADLGPPPVDETVAAPAPPVPVATASGPARNEANESEGWDAEDAALMAELDAMEVEMAGLEAHADALCTV